MRWALWMIRSRMASAIVGSPNTSENTNSRTDRVSCHDHRPASFLVRISAFRGAGAVGARSRLRGHNTAGRTAAFDPDYVDRSCGGINQPGLGCGRTAAHQCADADPIDAIFERESEPPRRGGDSRWSTKPFQVALRLHTCRFRQRRWTARRPTLRASGRSYRPWRKSRSPKRSLR
jgi:hypothetical protein